MNKLLSLLLILSLFSCVSVKIGDPVSVKSKKYSYESPDKDFYRIKDEAVDVAWLSQKTSSTLSIKSKCSKNIDLDLDNWLSELNANLRSSEIISSERFKFSNRKALKAEVVTSLEGFENKLAITTFVKNSCQYILVMTSPSNSFNQDLPIYQKFLESFKAW